MPLDPVVKALLDQAAALNLPSLNTLSAPEARAAFSATRLAAGEPEPVARVEDRSIPGPAGDIPVRIYCPEGEPPFPLVVYFHGGGWVIGDLDTHDGTCRTLTNLTRCVTVSVSYRLAPEHKFPAAVEDAFAATEWAASNASALGADARRLAVAGDSAGGNLAAAVSLIARDGGSPKIAHQALIYPVTDFGFDRPSYESNAEGYFLTKEMMRWFWGHYVASEADAAHPHASPLRASDLSGLPPALIITAEFDPLRDEGEAYGARLQEAGVPATVSRYDGMIHGFVGMAALIPQGRQALQETAQALRSAFEGAPVA
jgi:acetyl esterase